MACASALHGMDEKPDWYLLPEIHKEIITTALKLSDNLNEAIKTIKRLSALHGVHYDNFKDSANLMNALANKFPNKSRNEIILTLDNQALLEEFKSLPQKLKQEIAKMIVGDNLEETIKTIDIASAVWGIHYDNLKAFTTPVHILADKFNTTTENVAKKFKTLIAEFYIYLSYQLLDQVSIKSLFNKDTFENFIAQGVDVNFIPYGDGACNALRYAIDRLNFEAVKILLNAGANIDPESISEAEFKVKYYASEKLLAEIQGITQKHEEFEKAITIEKMLEEEQQKRATITKEKDL